MTELVAFRGGERIDVDKLRAHLSLLLRVENISVLLGSGASLEAGGKTMKGVWDDLKADFTATHAWLLSEKYAADDADGEKNFEKIIDKLKLSQHFYQDIQPDATKLAAIKPHLENLQRCILKACKLNDALWTNDWNPLKSYQNLLVRLCSNRQPGQLSPWVFTLNYDLAIEWAAESLGIHINNGFKGVHYRKFDSTNFDLAFRNIHARGEAQYGIHGINLVKLHGSLSWREDSKDLRELPSGQIKAEIDNFIQSKPNCEWPGFMIYPSSAKYTATAGFIYGELIRRFHEFISKEQSAIIISGYSFGDDHINRVLMSALENPTIQLVIFSTDFDGTEASIADKKVLLTAFKNQFPNVTIVGKSSAVYFNKVSELLPIPAIYDQRREELKRMLRTLEESTPTVGTPVASVTPAPTPASVEEPTNA